MDSMIHTFSSSRYMCVYVYIYEYMCHYWATELLATTLVGFDLFMKMTIFQGTQVTAGAPSIRYLRVWATMGL